MFSNPSSTADTHSDFEKMDAERQRLEKEIQDLFEVHHQTSLMRSAWNTRLQNLANRTLLPKSVVFFEFYKQRRADKSILEKMQIYINLLKNDAYQTWLHEKHVAQSKIENENSLYYQAFQARADAYEKRVDAGIIDVYEGVETPELKYHSPKPK